MSLSMIIVITGIIFYLTTCLAFLDISKKDFGAIHKKALWGFIALVPFVGCMIYFIFGYKKGKKAYKLDKTIISKQL